MLEGAAAAIDALIAKLDRDPRHAKFIVVQDVGVEERAFGEWAMTRPTNDRLFRIYEHRMRAQLEWLRTELSSAFGGIMTSAIRPAPAQS